MVYGETIEQTNALNERNTSRKVNLLQYPLDRQDRVKARVKFQPVEVLPPEVDTSRFSKGAKELALGDVSESEWFNPNAGFNDARKKQRISQNDIGDNLNTAAQDRINTLKVNPTNDFVYLYTPISLQFNDGVDISNANLNVGGAATLGSLSQGGDVLGSLMSGIGSAAGNIFDLIFKGGTLDAAGAVTASRLVDLIPGLSVAANATRVALQVTANPNVRAVFQGVKLRSFNFQFKFIPVSQNEAIEVEKIIRFFRREMYPEHINLTGNSNIPYGYKFPNLFKIAVQYDTSTNDINNFRSLPNMSIGLSYLSNITHNYNPSASVYHKDGRPSEIDLTLVFTEYRTLSKKDVDNDELSYGERLG